MDVQLCYLKLLLCDCFYVFLCFFMRLHVRMVAFKCCCINAIVNNTK